MTAKSFDEVKDFWFRAAAVERDAQGLRPTARDPYMQELIEAAVEQWLKPEDRLLDVGCGDGESTMRFAQKARDVVGVDYIDAFVRKAASAAAKRALSNVRFYQADALNLDTICEQHGVFDAAISIRCLINLGTWENQARALGQIAKCLKPGGLYLTSEGWSDGLEGLNVLRQRAGLPAISVVQYNLLLRRSQFEAEAERYFERVNYRGLGFYLFMSRVVQPVYVAPEEPSHDHPLNRVAAKLQSQASGDEFAGCDYAGVYVFRRKT